ncbi:hypothetical protein I5W14_22675, partial [Stenotrophomonas maltophilia]|nr:hypothetical protein [Stenotrophomonas maltophilia]
LQRAAQLAVEAARRAAEFGRLLARNATSAAGRYARAALEAIKTAGDHRHVAWDLVDGQWREVAKSGRDGSELSELTVVQTILEHSPGHSAIKANLDPAARSAVLAQARAEPVRSAVRGDQRDAESVLRDGPKLGR